MTITNDILLQQFFEISLWEEALKHGLEKHLNYSILRELCNADVRADLYRAIRDGRYHILPPRAVLVPKDVKGEYRTVYINEDADRVILHIANNLLMDTMSEMIHPSCLSYRRGIGCGKIANELARYCRDQKEDVIGWKADLSKYFDSVPIEIIDGVFDAMEHKCGRSALISMIREYYHSDEYIDPKGEKCQRYLSLRQGCSVSSFLANVVLKEVDELLSGMNGKYVRYSDDMIFVGPDYKQALRLLEERVASLGLSLNASKLQLLRKGEWFNFLGFSLRDGLVSLSPRRIKSFQREIEKRSIKQRQITLTQALRRVQQYMYIGDGEYSWATNVLPYINCRKDIDTLNGFVQDCLRAVAIGNRRIGGLGFDRFGEQGCICRGRGRNVKGNKSAYGSQIDSYMTIGCMKNALGYSHEVYEALVRNIKECCAHNSGDVKRAISNR